jgi:hypothetical protein
VGSGFRLPPFEFNPQAAAPKDELVALAADSLAAAASDDGAIPTRLELMDRFDKVASSAADLVLIPEGCGGIFAAGLSTLAGESSAM